MFNNLFLENCAFYESYVEKYCSRPHDNMVWRRCIVCWITKATNTHSDYVILYASPLRQWLHERASVLRYAYTAYLVQYYILRFGENGPDFSPKRRCQPTKPRGVKSQNDNILTRFLSKIIQPKHSLASPDQLQPNVIALLLVT